MLLLSVWMCNVCVYRVGLGGKTMQAMKKGILKAVGNWIEIDETEEVEVLFSGGLRV